MIRITPTISIEEQEIKEEFVRSSGPGGQNVNKVATAVKIRFDVAKSPSLPDDVRKRLKQLAGRRITRAGILVLDARRFRTQEMNRKDGLERLVELIKRASQKPRRRLKTKPTFASRKQRLETKRRRSDKKKMRGPVQSSE
jgi:ribosome-associated protein